MKAGLRWLGGAAIAAAVAWVAMAVLPGSAEWALVQRRDLVSEVPVEGVLEAVRSVTLSPPPVENMWQFKIVSLVTEGSDVAEGDPVVAFDGTELQQLLRRTIAERDQAEKELEKRTTDLEIEGRDLELRLAEARARIRKAEFLLSVPDEVVAASELEGARIDRRLARLEVEYLRDQLAYLEVRDELELGTLRSRHDLAASRVERIEQDLARLTLRAPRAGTVLLRESWNGEKPKVGETVWRMSSVAEIPDLSEMAAEAQVAEADAGRLAAGQTVTFRLDAYPDRELHGTIASIRRAVIRKSRSNPAKVVQLRIAIRESDPERLRPGMRLRGTVEIERLVDVLVVPEAAVVTGPEGAWVEVLRPFGNRRVRPELGRRDERFFEVVSGLEAGQRVRVARRGGAS